MHKKTLVSFDRSKYGESEFSHVMTLAKQRVAELMEVVLLRVYEIPFVTADCAMWDAQPCPPCQTRIKICVEN